MNYKELAKELCKEHCHHLCNDTTDCVVEEEAEELMDELVPKRNELPYMLTKQLQVSVKGNKSNNEIGELAQLIAKTLYFECGQKPCEECKWYDESFEETDCTDCLIAETLYEAGYRKQREGEWVADTWNGVRYREEYYDYVYKCSNCGALDLGNEGNYCHKCGAKMKGGEE